MYTTMLLLKSTFLVLAKIQSSSDGRYGIFKLYASFILVICPLELPNVEIMLFT